VKEEGRFAVDGTKGSRAERDVKLSGPVESSGKKEQARAREIHRPSAEASRKPARRFWQELGSRSSANQL